MRDGLSGGLSGEKPGGRTFHLAIDPYLDYIRSCGGGVYEIIQSNQTHQLPEGPCR